MNDRSLAAQIAAIHDHMAKGEVYRGYQSLPVAASGVIGDIETHDNQARILCRDVGAVDLILEPRWRPDLAAQGGDHLGEVARRPVGRADQAQLSAAQSVIAIRSLKTPSAAGAASIFGIAASSAWV